MLPLHQAGEGIGVLHAGREGRDRFLTRLFQAYRHSGSGISQDRME